MQILVANPVEFGDHCNTALRQAVNPLFQVLRLARLGRFFRACAANLDNSRGHFARVLAIDRNCFPLVVQHSIGHCRRDGSICFCGNAYYLRKLEISELGENLTDGPN
jgi:hypothetical protein